MVRKAYYSQDNSSAAKLPRRVVAAQARALAGMTTAAIAGGQRARSLFALDRPFLPRRKAVRSRTFAPDQSADLLKEQVGENETDGKEHADTDFYHVPDLNLHCI